MGADKTMTESKNMTAFKRILGAVSDLCASAELLDWDMHTFMPPGSIDSRSHQIATLQETAHEKMVSPELGKLLGKLEKETASLNPDSDDFRLVRIDFLIYRQTILVVIEAGIDFSHHLFH